MFIGYRLHGPRILLVGEIVCPTRVFCVGRPRRERLPGIWRREVVRWLLPAYWLVVVGAIDGSCRLAGVGVGLCGVGQLDVHAIVLEVGQLRLDLCLCEYRQLHVGTGVIQFCVFCAWPANRWSATFIRDNSDDPPCESLDWNPPVRGLGAGVRGIQLDERR